MKTRLVYRNYGKCKKCGYTIPAILVTHALFDYGCPRCGASFTMFNCVRKGELIGVAEEEDMEVEE